MLAIHYLQGLIVCPNDIDMAAFFRGEDSRRFISGALRVPSLPTDTDAAHRSLRLEGVTYRMQALLRLSRNIDAFMELIGRATTWIVTLLLAVGVYNVIARYVGRYVGMNLASNTFIEGQWYLFSIIFFLGFAYILKRNAHVRVDFLYSKQTPVRRAWVNLLGTLLFLIPFCILGIYVTWPRVLRSWGRLPNGRWSTWELSSDPGGLPRAPIRTMIIIAFVLLIIQGISEIIKHLAVITHQVKDEEIVQLEEYEAQAID
jgi:TRAP-type mannitol/chloroaromatic compound transport system permease small subunit